MNMKLSKFMKNKNMDKMPKNINEYMNRYRSKGGKVRGRSKVRGDSEYYRNLAKKRKDRKLI